jgi:DNA-3-methyladenine glycosylase II
MKINNLNPGNSKSFGILIPQPYDFGLTMRAIQSFQQGTTGQDGKLRIAAKIEGIPTSIEVTSKSNSTREVWITSTPEAGRERLREIVDWVLFSELDLEPFYLMLDKDTKLKSIPKELFGLKPIRPISLFEMAVIAITEQQISLAAANHIRARLVERFGEPIDNQWIFPEAAILAKASPEDFRSCGLSRQKASYIQELAMKVADGTTNLDSLKKMEDDQVRETIMNLKGFGRWSADYILVRGLARPDCIPIDDIAIRSLVGEYLGSGQRVSSIEVEELLKPYKPFRGLVAFYLLAKKRLILKATA